MMQRLERGWNFIGEMQAALHLPTAALQQQRLLD
jgi:hypothetical protein